ncbi:MAG: hypothetical protein A2511_00710 [Deltaproteobacteria bacterium RIFOXYD12_FULL_50_9]|nr:MAG: hypothetical protein A2511_00710 [Deltaproteobacteria bacterium RIFOXYD12_FULL_50_9]
MAYFLISSIFYPQFKVIMQKRGRVVVADFIILTFGEQLMKRTIIMSILLAMVVAGGWSLAQAGHKGMRCNGQQAEAKEQGCQSRMGCNEDGVWGSHLARMTAELGLSESQQQEIEALMAAQKEKNTPLREKILAGKRQLCSASGKDDMSDAAIQDLADEQARLMSEMMVSRVQVKKQILALLTPQQKKMAEKLQGVCADGRGCGSACGSHD